MAPEVTDLKAPRNTVAAPSSAPRAYHPHARWRGRWAYAAALLLFCISILAGTTAGTIRIAPGSIVHAIAGNQEALSPAERTILIHVRVPRVLAAALIGATLSLAGGLFQGLFRNPMADPYVLGTPEALRLARPLGSSSSPRLPCSASVQQRAWPFWAQCSPYFSCMDLLAPEAGRRLCLCSWRAWSSA